MSFRRPLSPLRALVLLAAGACGGDAGPTGPGAIASVAITPGDVAFVSLGETETLSATARDASGGTVGGASFVWSSDDASVATVSPAGVVTAVGNGTARITALTEGASGSATVVVSQEVAAVQLAPGGDTLTAFGQTRALTATAVDAGGSPVDGVAFSWSSSDESVATVDTDGVVTAVGNGEAEVVATAGTFFGSAPLAVIQQVSGVQLSPTSASLGTVGETTQFAASAVDANGNPVEDLRWVWLSSDQSVAVVDTLGMATSRGDGAATISAVAQGVPGYATVTVNQSVAGLAFVTDPTDATAGDAIDPAIQVEVVDASGNRVESASLAVTLGVGANPGGGVLTGTKTVNAVSGVATFSGLAIEAAGAGYTLTAAASGVPGASSASFDIDAGPAAGLAFGVQPTAGTAGAALSPAVEVRIIDAYGNLVDDATNAVNLALGANPGNDTLGGTVTAAAAAGVATFDDLSLTVATSGYTLAASSPGLSGAEGGAFAIGPGAAAGLQVQAPTTPAEGQEPFAATVWVVDDWGNLVPTATNTVTVALDDNPSGAALGGTVSAAAVAGVATFPDLTVDLPEDGYTLGATATGLTPGSSDGFEVNLTFAHVGRFLGNHQCAVTETGHAYCWGRNANGQVGDGTTDGRATPVPVGGGITFASVTGGGGTSCGLTPTGVAYCWGFNDAGQLGNGTTVDAATPQPVSGGHTFVSLEVGFNHTCGVTDLDEAWCWGLNADGQLGVGDTTDRSVPTLVSGGHTFASVTLGETHSCGLTADPIALCWGEATDGRLGNGDDTTNRTAPDTVAFELEYTSLTAGFAHTCGTYSGVIWCWGSNQQGAVDPAEPFTNDYTTPEAVSGMPGDLTDLSGGYLSTCGLTGRGYVWCWGSIGGSGEYADGARSFESVASGFGHVCALTAEPALWCWGGNGQGQLGDGTGEGSYAPVRVKQ